MYNKCQTYFLDSFVLLLVLEVIALSPRDCSIEKLLLPENGSSQNADAESRITWMKKQIVHTNEKLE